MSDTNSRDSFEYLSENDQDPTLESILAEFKGSAYIAGEKKSSPHLLDERIKRIVQESRDGSLSSTELYTINGENVDIFSEIKDTPVVEEPVTLTAEDIKYAAKTAEIDWEPVKGATSLDEVRREAAAFFAKRDEAVERRAEEILVEKQEARRRAEEERRLAEEEKLRQREAERKKALFGGFDFTSEKFEDDSDLIIDFSSFTSEGSDSEEEIEVQTQDEGHKTEILFFDNYRFADDSEEQYAAEDTYEADESEKEVKRPGLFARIFKKKDNYFDDEAADEVQESDEEYVFDPEPEVYVEEPDFAKEAAHLTKVRNLLMIKSRLALVVSVIMGVFTILFDKGVDILGIGSNTVLFTAVMVVMQLVVMALSLEIIDRGITSIFKREMSAETLVLFSNLVTVVASCVSMVSGGEMGAPFCAVAAFSAAFSLWGEFRQFAAMSLSLKTAVASANPQVLSSQYIKDLDASLIRKYYNSAAGFYNNLVETDIADQTYKFFTPFILIASVLLSAVSTLGGNANFVYCLSAVAAAGASFSAMSAFSVPFSKVARRLRRSGAAVAGWGGTDDIYYADGVRLTDSDIFPDGAQVSGPTALENIKPDKILRYSASLMIASNSGLSKGFEELMNKQGITMVGVENFECYEGGYGAVIRGERVVCGSAACMALLGIRVPQSVNSKNAVFTAINDTLAGTFSVTYKPLKTVQNALLALLGSKSKLFFAVRDFNITPLMVQQKLQIPVEEIEYLPTVDAYKMTNDVPDEVPHTVAVIARNTPGVYADTVTSARGLRVISMINTAVSIISAILGMLIVFLLSWRSDGSMISPSNLMEYMLAVEIAVILLSNAI